MTEQAYRQSEKTLATPMDDETVMMDIEKGTYFGIRGVGTLIWKLLEKPQTVSSLTDAIGAVYEVDSETARADVSVFLDNLADNGLVTPA